MNKIVLVAPLAGAALLAGCGSSSHASRNTVPPLQTGTTSAGTPTSAAPTVTSTVTQSPTGPAACATAHLAVSLGDGNGAAGSLIYPLHFVNKGSAACTITGYPGVSFVAPGSGQQVGPAAQRDGGPAATVTLAPGAEATASIRIVNYQNFSPSDCAPAPVSGLRVYPPGNTAAAYVSFTTASQEACSKGVAGGSEISVMPVKAGDSGI